MKKRQLLHILLGLFLLASIGSVLAQENSKQDDSLTSEVRMFKGAPALYVNGQLTSQVLAAPYIPGPADFTDFTRAGISIFNIYLRFDWKGTETYDFQKIDAKMDEYLKLKPDALFIPRILLTQMIGGARHFQKRSQCVTTVAPLGCSENPVIRA